jgi:hypothetical protein
MDETHAQNATVAKEVLKMYGPSDEVLGEIYYDYMISSGRMQEMALKMINKGYALEEVADNISMPLEWVREVAEQAAVAV